MKQTLVALAFFAVALAGCSDDASSEPEDMDSHHGPSEYGGDTSLVTEAPEWEVGQYWTFRANGTDFDMVVAADEGTSWLLLQNDPGNAYFDFLLDVSFLGSIQKSDLSGKQGTDTVKFFDFPLEHNKGWMSSWDGENRHIVAHAADGGKWHILVHAGGSDSGARFAEYLYDPAIGWFEEMTFYGDDGEVAYFLELTGSGTDYRGEVFRYSSVEVVHENMIVGPAGSATQDTFEIGDDVSELRLFWHILCSDPDAPLFAFQPPGADGSAAPLPPLPFVSQDAYGNQQPCPEVEGLEAPLEVTPQPGTWRMDGIVPGQSVLFTWAEARVRETFSF